MKWNKVCHSRNKGGLGVRDVRLANLVFLLNGDGSYSVKTGHVRRGFLLISLGLGWVEMGGELWLTYTSVCHFLGPLF
jgi:hypothetical protein